MRLGDQLNGVEAGGGLKGDAWVLAGTAGRHFGRWQGED